MDKYKNKYKIGSHRLLNWDYSSNALYFLTIVTQNRECILGDIVAGEIQLSEMGKIVQKEFLQSFEIRNELFVHEYIIMPNHLHMIVEIWHPGNESNDLIDNVNVQPHGRAVQPNRAVQQLESIKPNRPVRLPKSISSFIAGFKSAVNTKIDDYIDEHHLPIPKYNKHNHFFQPNYHDHIVRNDFEYQRIANYIIQNPIVWENDKLNLSNPKKF
ncbi:transposase [Flavobacterium flavigenum]|uniref:transposase n=1 Tax=Flavobacterium flavigenum TaxID=3003258 RepID=UPI0024823119|nr:transposase [Flavobacterium flavigenum]